MQRAWVYVMLGGKRKRKKKGKPKMKSVNGRSTCLENTPPTPATDVCDVADTQSSTHTHDHL